MPIIAIKKEIWIVFVIGVENKIKTVRANIAELNTVREKQSIVPIKPAKIPIIANNFRFCFSLL